jgi:exopolysaccharide biosynthesis polyprenyl glycosylphosphotransferase
VSGQVVSAGREQGGLFAVRAARRPVGWTGGYLRMAAVADVCCAVAATLLAVQLRFDNHLSISYAVFSAMLPLLWLAALVLAGGYDSRFIGVGSEEFRKVLNAGVSLTAVVAIFSYAADVNLSRGYVVIALPSVTLFDLVVRYIMRRHLHRMRGKGYCMRKVVAVGHERALADLIAELRRESYHGLNVVGACVAGPSAGGDIAGVPVNGDIDSVTDTVSRFGADTVAVLACPEINGTKLREMAWELEKTGTDFCVAPALVDVAGPRTTIRPAAGLTLVHVDHPELDGIRLVLKGLFDRLVAAAGLLLLAPMFAVVCLAIVLHDGGPAFFRQIRVGKDGHVFKLYKFRTMVMDAERRKTELLARNDSDGVLFKLRVDPRITRIGARLRRWSIDEFPQLINVLRGDMSLVGPRPALPEEAAVYADHVRRRLAVKPGITGLWQVSGRSDLSWDESVRLDLRYVENWSFALDLQILWKTGWAVTRGSGAY